MELYLAMRDDDCEYTNIGIYTDLEDAEKEILEEKERNPKRRYLLCQVIAVPRKADIAKDKFYLEPAENIRRGGW